MQRILHDDKIRCTCTIIMFSCTLEVENSKEVLKIIPISYLSILLRWFVGMCFLFQVTNTLEMVEGYLNAVQIVCKILTVSVNRDIHTRYCS